MTTVVKLITRVLSALPKLISPSLQLLRVSLTELDLLIKKDPSHDKSARLRFMHQGIEICNNFNSFKGCFHVSSYLKEM